MRDGADSNAARTSVLDSTEAVDATVTAVSIETDHGKSDSHTPRATYEYTHEGETYTSSNSAVRG